MSEAAKAAAAIVGHFRDQPFSDEALASALGYGAVNGGAFRQKIADLRKYGVVTGRGSQLAAGPIAQSIYADRPGERAKALAEMLENIPLFKALRDQFGDKVPDDHVLVTALLNITNAPRPDIESSLVMLRDSYKDARGTIPAMSGSMKATGSAGQLGHRMEGAMSRGAETGGSRFSSTTEDYEFTVADDMEAIDSLIDQLQSRRKALERKRHSTPRATGPEGPGPGGRNVTASIEGVPTA
jgi:hypothetical protein